MTSRISITRIRALPTASQFLSRSVTRRATRSYATEPPPPPHYPAPRQPSRAGTFYKSFGSPVLKCFLGALFTYQLVYWSWMKLESIEQKKDYEDEIVDLKAELKELLLKKAEAERLLKDESRGKKENDTKKRGWLW